MTIDQVAAEIKEIRPTLQKAFSEAGSTLDMDKVTAFGEGLDTHAKSVRLAAMNVRLSELGERKQALEAAEQAKAQLDSLSGWLDQPAGGAPFPVNGNGRKAYVPFAELAMKDRSWFEGVRGKSGPALELDIDAKDFLEREVKTVMSTGAGYAPQAIRSGIVVPAAFQAPAVIDLIPIVRTDQSAYVFMRQTTRTNNAAEIAESTNGSLQSLAESAFAWTEISETIRKIGHFVPVTDEQLEDIAGMEDLIRNDMVSGVRERLSDQILDGNGTAPNIEGFLDAGRDTTDVNTIGDFIADAVDKMIEQVEVTGMAQADGIVLHPSDWHGYRRATTADGIYIAGHPSQAVAAMMWGLPVVLTSEIAQGTGLVGAFARYSRLVVKRGVEVQISSEHASYFIQGLKAVKAEMRATLAVLRETAFAKTDDIVVS